MDKREINIEFDVKSADALRDLARYTEGSPKDVVVKAVAIYRFILEHHKIGEKVMLLYEKKWAPYPCELGEIN